MHNTTQSEIKRMKISLKKSWSNKSSSLFSITNPAKGQCGVTALVVNAILGGEILKTQLDEGWHYYNRINGEVIDFTKSQFESPINYDNLVSSREEAFTSTCQSQYENLRDAVGKLLNE